MVVQLWSGGDVSVSDDHEIDVSVERRSLV